LDTAKLNKRWGALNKLELIRQLAETQGISIAEARQAVELFFGSISNALSDGDRVEIRGLCSFKAKTYKGYKGRNPKTGETVIIKSKRLPVFKPGTNLKNRVDSR
jgi:integration host factor subunit beta